MNQVLGVFLHNFFLKNCKMARSYVFHVMTVFPRMILKKVSFAETFRAL